MSKNEIAYIYTITCSETQKVYVGSAKNMAARTKGHFTALNKGKHENSYLQRAWKKYGETCFKLEVIETCPLEMRWEREQWWINKHNSSNQKYGYNLLHSVRQTVPSPVMSRMLKRFWKKRWANKEYAEQRTEQLRGLSNLPGVREKMQASKLASWQDPEYRKLQSKVHKEYSQKKENRERLSVQASSAWADPVYRAKQMAERKKRFKDPAFIAKLSEAAKNRKDRRKNSSHSEIV